MAGLIDKAAELARNGKEIARRENELGGLEARLADDRFVNGAPAAVIEKQRARIAQLRQELATLREQEARIREL
jgi:valyl-tRNA synthetase